MENKAEQPKVKGSGRFDYVKYDEQSISLQEQAKTLCRHLEAFINNHVQSGRPKATSLTKLEECFAWIGKGIRDDQVLRNNGAELQEERNDTATPESKITYASDYKEEQV